MEFLKVVWDNIGNIESTLSIIVILCSTLAGIKSIVKLIKLKKYLLKWLPQGALSSARYYIETRGQQEDPCNFDEIYNAYNYKLTKRLIPFFLDEVFASDIQNQYFVVLGDSGTGKTTFMVQLFKTYRKKMWKKHKIEFIPLFFGDCINEIRKIPNPENTILLLDGLDENTEALKNYEDFIEKLLNCTGLFYRVIITCRTQFFPNKKEEPYETGRIRFSTQSKRNEFYKLYISPFGDQDIKRFLKKKYPFIFNTKKRKKAREIISKSPYLMVRPMLLSYIDDLLNGNTEYKYIHQIYSQLTDNWIQRESIAKDKLDRFTRITAVFMYRNNSNYIGAQDIANICRENRIDLCEIDAKSRSLLNRNGIGDYKFAHKSIYEYILAREAMDNLEFRIEHDFSKLDMAQLFFREMCSIYLERELADKHIQQSDFTKMEIVDIDFSDLVLSTVFRSATIRRCCFDKCHFFMSDLDNSDISDCDFNSALFIKKSYKGICFMNCVLRDTKFDFTEFYNCTFYECDMRGANLECAQIKECIFIKSNLAFAILNNAEIKNSIFTDVTLGPLEYKNLQADPQILRDIELANTVAQIFINNGCQEAKENGIRIVSNIL